MNRGDIYLVSLDPALGREQKGFRPVLVVSTSRFNSKTGAPVVLPITNGGAFALRLGLAVEIHGIGTTGVVRCDQPRTIDLEARKARKVDTLPVQLVEEVIARLGALFR